MPVAMMTPVTLPAARFVAFNSFRRRRLRALAAYELGAVGVFVGFTVGSMLLIDRLPGDVSNTTYLAISLGAAATWQLTRWKRRALLSCRRTRSLGSTGWRADAACANFGVRQAARCLASAWPLMLVVAVGHVHPATMAAATGVMLLEERPRIARRTTAPLAVAFAAAALAALV